MLSKINYGKFIQENFLLDCGLEVQYFPYPEYHTNFVGFIIPNGSNMSEYLIDGIKVKTGIAHFLEHRMFESKSGSMMNEFARLGASVNAYTTFDRTCYFYSTTSKSNKPFELLFDLVTSFVSSQVQIDNEKKIILEESKMIQANPYSSLNYQVNQGLFTSSYLKDPIVGYKEDIKLTNIEDLNLAFESFYSLDKMILVIIGPKPVKDYLDYISSCNNNIKVRKHQIRRISKIEDFSKVNQKIVKVNKEVSTYTTLMSFKTSIDNLQLKYDYHHFLALINASYHLLFSQSSKLVDEFNHLDNVLTNSLQSNYFDDNNISVMTLCFTTSNDISNDLNALNNPENYISELEFELFKKTLKMENLNGLTNLYYFFDEVLSNTKRDSNFLEYYMRNDQITLDDVYSFLKTIGQSEFTIGQLKPKGEK